jgi:hypothetical protein
MVARLVVEELSAGELDSIVSREQLHHQRDVNTNTQEKSQVESTPLSILVSFIFCTCYRWDLMKRKGNNSRYLLV